MEARPNRRDFAKNFSEGFFWLAGGALFALIPGPAEGGIDYRISIFFGFPIARGIVGALVGPRLPNGTTRATLRHSRGTLVEADGTLSLRDGLLVFKSRPLEFAIGNQTLGTPTVLESRRLVVGVPGLPEEATLMLQGDGVRALFEAWRGGSAIPTRDPIPAVVTSSQRRIDGPKLLALFGLETLFGALFIGLSSIGSTKMETPYLFLLAPILGSSVLIRLAIETIIRRQEVRAAESLGFRVVPA